MPAVRGTDKAKQLPDDWLGHSFGELKRRKEVVTPLSEGEHSLLAAPPANDPGGDCLASPIGNGTYDKRGVLKEYLLTSYQLPSKDSLVRGL